MKKRLRLTFAFTQSISRFMAKKTFADEEAIETFLATLPPR